MKKLLLLLTFSAGILMAESCVDKTVDYVKINGKCIELQGVYGKKVRKLTEEYLRDQKAFNAKYSPTPPMVPTLKK